MKKEIMKGIVISISFCITTLITILTYASWINLSNVTSSDTLTATGWNNMVSNINDLNNRINNQPNIPTGFVGAFNLTTCPSGWIAANGANGTPDLRGEFIRGWDNGRGVDSGRSIGTFQRGSLVMNTINHGDARVFSLLQSNDLGYDPAITNSSQTYGRRDNPASGGGAPGTWGGGGYVDTNYVKMTRPRNVALLYCVKQ